MKTIIDKHHRASTLLAWKGANAKVWMFHATHKRLALMLSRPGEPEVVYVVANGCEHIIASFSWKGANLEIISNQDTQAEDAVHKIIDKANGFELQCSSVIVVRATATDFDQSFENFFSDE